MDEPGIVILRDIWFSFEKNQPEEVRALYQKYLKEIKEDVERKWANRERTIVDLRVLKEWYVKDWHTRTSESLYREIVSKFTSLGFIEDGFGTFSQMPYDKARVKTAKINYQRYKWHWL